MQDATEEANRETPVSERCDVAVAGGGVGGIAAALAAARAGADTLLIENQCVLGGLATAGIVTIYLPLCDGMGRQMSFGVAEELFRLSVLHGAQAHYPSAWLESGGGDRARQRFEVQFNPVYFALEAERLLREAGIRILYDTRLCAATVKGRRLDSLIIENESGRTAVRCKAAVDATGTAGLLRAAGEETRRHAAGNTVAGWYYSAGPDGLRLHMLGFADAAKGSERDGAAPGRGERFFGSDAREISAYLFKSHQMTLESALALADRKPGTEPAMMSFMPQYRMIRCLKGQTVLSEAQEGQHFPDSIGMVGDWRKRGPKYEVPYGILFGGRLDNLFAAGRCVSTDDGMWDIMRVIPCCAVTGEAAGVAAALTPQSGRTPAGQVQLRLSQAGQKLFISELDEL